MQLIHNLSHPFHDNSVNALITPQEVAIHYQKFEDVITMVGAAGPAAELGKFDLTDAYKHVLVQPDYWHMLGIHVRDGPKREFYIETTLPFGHHLAPNIFTAFSDVLVWVTRKFAVEALFKYVDDFVSIQPAGSGLCQWDLDAIRVACHLMGFDEQDEKEVLKLWNDTVMN